MVRFVTGEGLVAPDAADGEIITHAVAPDPEVEAKWVAQEIAKLHDGGRAWYTAGGHTTESFSEALFVDHLGKGILWSSGMIAP